MKNKSPKIKLKESKLRRIIRKTLKENMKFSQLPGYAKNTEMDIYDYFPGNKALRDEVFELIDDTYFYMGGNLDIRTAEDLADPGQNDYVIFKGWDIDNDPEPDVVRGMKPKAGKIKLSLSATDGSEAATNYSIADTSARLSAGGHYAEMSGKAATVQMKASVPAFTDESAVIGLLPGKNITWFGEHPYFYTGSDPSKQAIAEKFKDRGSEIEAAKSKEYGPNGQYDGWYVRQLGAGKNAKIKAKLMFGK